MDDKKKPENGTYTQVPNVFFDTCELPESAQILYLRLYRHIAYREEHKFIGSIRRLSTLVRLSKSTVDRMIKVLEESRLISIRYEISREQDTKIMAITINPQELWMLNKQHYENKDVPIWDKVMPAVKVLSQIGTLCPDMGQDVVNLGQDVVNLGQTVPDASSKSAQESISTINNLNNNERRNDAAQQKPNVTEEQESSHPSIQPSLSLSQDFSSQEETKSEIVFSPEAERVYELAAKLHLEFLKKDEKHRDYCNKLVNAGVTTLEKLKSLMEFCWQKPYLVREDGSKKPLCLGNLATGLDGWLQVQPTASPAKPRRTDDPLEKYRAAKERAEQSRLREEAQKTMVISSYDDDEYEDDSFYPAKVTESEMLEKIAYFSAHYGDDANIEANQRKAMELRSELGVSLERFYDNLFHAQTMADHRGNTMPDFFEQLRQVILEKVAERVG